jgi:cytochrome c oxidase subunit 1
MIGKQFLITTLLFFIVGGLLALGVRWQLAYPNTEMPFFGKLLQPETGIITPEQYNMLFTMHASVMIFLVIIPMLNGAFANFLIPLQIGADDMAFPTLNALSYWAMWPAAGLFVASFFVEGGAAATGWTGYPPLSDLPGVQPAQFGQTLWVAGVFLIGLSSLMGAVNYTTTIIMMRAPGMTMFRLPLTVWSLFINAILTLFSTPVLGSAMLLMFADRVLGTSFFIPDNVVVADELVGRPGGGHVILWQHLFWFYSHPAVYIMILPAMGMTSDILATFARKPIFGYRPMVYSICAIAGLGYVVWAHHMFQSGMNPTLAMGFMVSTMMIALPSAIKTFNWLGTLWGGQIRFTSAMLMAISFVSMFVIGGLSGLFMAATPVDMFIHDTYYIVGHIHYVLFGGATFAIFAGIYYWFPKMFGRFMNEPLGKIHWLLSFIFFNGTFFTMHILGAEGMPRRIADPYIYDYLKHLQPLNIMMTWCAIGLGVAQIPFAINFVSRGRRTRWSGPPRRRRRTGTSRRCPRSTVAPTSSPTRRPRRTTSRSSRRVPVTRQPKRPPRSRRPHDRGRRRPNTGNRRTRRGSFGGGRPSGLAVRPLRRPSALDGVVPGGGDLRVGLRGGARHQCRGRPRRARLAALLRPHQSPGMVGAAQRALRARTPAHRVVRGLLDHPPGRRSPGEGPSFLDAQTGLGSPGRGHRPGHPRRRPRGGHGDLYGGHPRLHGAGLLLPTGGHGAVHEPPVDGRRTGGTRPGDAADAPPGAPGGGFRLPPGGAGVHRAAHASRSPDRVRAASSRLGSSHRRRGGEGGARRLERG